MSVEADRWLLEPRKPLLVIAPAGSCNVKSRALTSKVFLEPLVIVMVEQAVGAQRGVTRGHGRGGHLDAAVVERLACRTDDVAPLHPREAQARVGLARVVGLGRLLRVGCRGRVLAGRLLRDGAGTTDRKSVV